MLNIQIDNATVEAIVREQLQKKIDAVEVETVYWDTKELQRQTGLSMPYIRENFLLNEDFPAFREGSHWRILAKEAKEFLENRAKQLMKTSRN